MPLQNDKSREELLAEIAALRAQLELREAAARQDRGDGAGMDTTQSRYARLVENLTSGVIVYEAVDGGEDFIIRDINPAGEAIEKATRTDLVGRRTATAFPAIAECGLLETLREVWATGKSQSMMPTQYCDDRSNSWREYHVFKLDTGEVFVIYEDVTSHMRSLEARRDADHERSRLEQAIEQASETIMITDTDGRIDYANPAFAHDSGYAVAEALGQKLDFIADPVQSVDARRQMWAMIQEGKTWSGHLHNLRKDGLPFEEEMTVSPVRNVRDEIINYVVVKRDVSEEVRIQSQLQKAQKMEAIGQLAGGVSHDFNNLLQIIFAHIQFAQQATAVDHPARTDLEEVMKTAEKAAALTRQLLAFGRRQVLQPVDVNINDLVGNLLKMLRRIISVNIDLDFIPGHMLGTVRADPVQVEQVLMNLCINARDAMPNGGRITIETENVLINGNYTQTHPWAKRGRFVLLSVADTGMGMSPEVKDRIFEPFFTTKAKDYGTGLGLATVYGIVKQHGGFIHVYSEPAKGSMFKVYFNLVERRAVDVSSQIKSQPPGGVETILIAEDNDQVRSVTKRLLVGNGYSVIEATNGREALNAIIDDVSEKISLVLLDVVMPMMSGPEAALKMQEIRPGVRLLFTSGYSAGGEQMAQLIEEKVPLIQKPYDPDDLLFKIREALDNPPPRPLPLR